jgi:hypothetical protein
VRERELDPECAGGLLSSFAKHLIKSILFSIHVYSRPFAHFFCCFQEQLIDEKLEGIPF